MNLRAKHPSNKELLQRKVVKYGRRKKITEKKKGCYLFGVIHGVHAYESKTSIKQRNTTKNS